MIHLTNKHPLGTGLHLSVTPQTQVRIALHRHATVYRSVRVVTGNAALAQCLMLEDVRFCLLLVTTDANGVPFLRSQPAGNLMDVFAVWLMAIDTTHPPLEDAVVVRQGELSVSRHVALEAGLRISAWIHNVRCKTGLNVFAARAVARLAAGQRCPLHLFPSVKTAMRTIVKSLVNFIVTLGTGLVANKGRTGNLRRSCHGGRRVGSGGAGNQDSTEERQAK